MTHYSRLVLGPSPYEEKPYRLTVGLKPMPGRRIRLHTTPAAQACSECRFRNMALAESKTGATGPGFLPAKAFLSDSSDFFEVYLIAGKWCPWRAMHKSLEGKAAAFSPDCARRVAVHKMFLQLRRPASRRRPIESIPPPLDRDRPIPGRSRFFCPRQAPRADRVRGSSHKSRAFNHHLPGAMRSASAGGDGEGARAEWGWRAIGGKAFLRER